MTSALTNQRRVFKACLTQTERVSDNVTGKIGPLDFIYLYKRCRNNFDPIVLCLKLALKSGKLEEYKVAKAIIQYALPGLLVTKWPCLRGQSVRTGQKIVRGDKFVFKPAAQ